MGDGITVHPRVSKGHPDITDGDVKSAWRNAVAIVNRTYTPPDIYASAGADGKGRMLEMWASKWMAVACSFIML